MGQLVVGFVPIATEGFRWILKTEPFCSVNLQIIPRRQTANLLGFCNGNFIDICKIIRQTMGAFCLLNQLVPLHRYNYVLYPVAGASPQWRLRKEWIRSTLTLWLRQSHHNVLPTLEMGDTSVRVAISRIISSLHCIFLRRVTSINGQIRGSAIFKLIWLISDVAVLSRRFRDDNNSCDSVWVRYFRVYV